MGTVAQHLTPRAGEVLILPFEVAKSLIQNHPNQWQPLIIVPDIIPTGLDGATGLDTLDVAISTVWGITPNGTLYWDDAGVDGADVATVTYSNGTAIFDGGYGISVAKPMLRRKLAQHHIYWQKEGYERVDVTIKLNHDGIAREEIDVPKSAIRLVEISSNLSVFDHPNITLTWQAHGRKTVVTIDGATPTVHPDSPLSVVITYWRKFG